MAVRKNAPLSLDQWLPYDFKDVIDNPDHRGITWLVPDWIGTHRRRLQSYAMLQGYRDNAARMFKEIFGDSAEVRIERDAQRNRREYGDAALLIETARSKLLGDQQSIVVDHADEFEEKADKNTAEAKSAAERQDELREWAEADGLLTSVIETERNSTTFGDGLYTEEWNADKDRSTIRPWEPDCYFPVLEGVAQGDYPSKVHLAWELTDEEAEAKYGETKDTIVHRITYEMKQVDPYRMPWSTKPETKRCFMTEMEFRIKQQNRSVDDLTIQNAVYMTKMDAKGTEYEVRDIDLGIDYLPVVHISNTVAKINHYGDSTVARVMQLLDDISGTDSDVQASAELVGNPMYIEQGGNDKDNRVGPGVKRNLDVDGKAYFISGGEHLAGLMDHREKLLERLAVNSRITAAAQGRVDTAKVQAGVILFLTFGPLISLVDEMRLARVDKYRTLLKFVQRRMILNGVWSGEVLKADLVFGSFLPSDRSQVVTDVLGAYKGGAISLETSIRMLIEVGFPIDDIAEEIERINSRDFEGATQLLDATGNDEAVGDFLGVKVEKPDPAELAQQMQAAGENQPPGAASGDNKPDQDE